MGTKYELMEAFDNGTEEKHYRVLQVKTLNGRTETYRVGDFVYIHGDKVWVAQILQIYDSRPVSQCAEDMDEVSIVADSQAEAHYRVKLRWFYRWSEMNIESRNAWLALSHQNDLVENELFFSDNIENQGNTVQCILSHARIVDSKNALVRARAQARKDEKIHLVRCFYGFSCGTPPPIRALVPGELLALKTKPSTARLFRAPHKFIRGCRGPAAKGLHVNRYSPTSRATTDEIKNHSQSSLLVHSGTTPKINEPNEPLITLSASFSRFRPKSLNAQIALKKSKRVYNLRSHIRGPSASLRNSSGESNIEEPSSDPTSRIARKTSQNDKLRKVSLSISHNCSNTSKSTEVDHDENKEKVKEMCVNESNPRRTARSFLDTGVQSAAAKHKSRRLPWIPYSDDEDDDALTDTSVEALAEDSMKGMGEGCYQGQNIAMSESEPTAKFTQSVTAQPVEMQPDDAQKSIHGCTYESSSKFTKDRPKWIVASNAAFAKMPHELQDFCHSNIERIAELVWKFVKSEGTTKVAPKVLAALQVEKKL